jgi:ribosome maturation factor RimP
MASIAAGLKKTVSGIAEGLGYECVGVEQRSSRSCAVLAIYIDSPEGIRHADCEKVSRAVSECLDDSEGAESKFFAGKYFIEVSSPGIERPLFTEGHYARFVGSAVDLSVKGRGKIEGVLLSCENGVVALRTGENEDIRLPFCDIRKGKIALRK